MFSSRKRIICIFLVITMCFSINIPKAKAFLDPVTIAILTPIALQAAETMMPYVQRGLVSGAQGLLTCGKDTLEILYLPLGVTQMTLFAPFGGLSSGMTNITQGLIAPFKLTLDVLLLPIRFLGISM